MICFVLFCFVLFCFVGSLGPTHYGTGLVGQPRVSAYRRTGRDQATEDRAHTSTASANSNTAKKQSKPEKKAPDLKRHVYGYTLRKYIGTLLRLQEVNPRVNLWPLIKVSVPCRTLPVKFAFFYFLCFFFSSVFCFPSLSNQTFHTRKYPHCLLLLPLLCVW